MSHNYKRLLLLKVAKLFDLAVVTTTFLVAFAIASGTFTWTSFSEVLALRIKIANFFIFASFLAICACVFSLCGFYQSHRISGWARWCRESFLATGLITVALLASPFHLEFATEYFFLLFSPLMFTVLLLSRLITQSMLFWLRLHGRNLRHVVVVGDGPDAARLGDHIEQESTLGYRLVRIIDAGLFKVPEVSVVHELDSVIAHQPVDEVILALPANKYNSATEILVHHCEEQGITVRVHADIFSLQVARPYADDLRGIPVVTFQSGPVDGWPLVIKRAIDIVGSAALLVALAPLFAFVALLIKFNSPGPIIFAQERVGYNKRRFKVLKFRTMGVEAENQQHMLEHLNEVEGPVFKIKKDPRITHVGAFLRRFSIDELPQLINVLKGEMSLVGPRPLPVRDVERIDVRWHKRRFSIKPGLTCLWQVNGRSNVGFSDWVRMDLDYIDTWSLRLDILILLKTIPAVFKGPGAY